MNADLLIIFALILLNGSLALAEMSLVAAKKARLEAKAAAGSGGAARALRLLENPTRFLSSIQVGITLIGILTGAFGGAALADEAEAFLLQFSILAQYAQPLGLLVVVIPITYVSLIIGELVPKRLALSNPESFASAMAIPMHWVSLAATPLVWLLTISTDFLLRLLRIEKPDQTALLEDDIRALLREGAQTGVLEHAEREMAESVLQLADRSVAAIMTPRTELEWIDLEDDFGVTRELLLVGQHTRYPVAAGSLDDTQGYVRAREALALIASEQPVDLTALVVSAPYLPESTTALRALETLRSERAPLAFVMDEFGGLEGMVTLADILSAIVGGNIELHDHQEDYVVLREDGSYLVDGAISPDALRRVLPWPLPPTAFSGDFHTLGGYAMVMLGRIPKEGDRFADVGIEFEIVDMDGMRVDKILVQRKPDTAPLEPAERAPQSTESPSQT